MITTLLLGFAAGALSTLSPCVLPLLPILLGGALQRHPWAPVALAGGLAASFTGVGLAVASLGFAAGIDGKTIRMAAAVLMAAFGLVLLSARAQVAFAGITSRASAGMNGVIAGLSGDSLGGQVLLGLLLGAAWSPCAGPTLGAAVGLAAGSGTALKAAGVMAAFSLGAVTPLLALAYGSRRALTARKERMARLAAWAKPAMGAALLAMGVLIVSGLDKGIEAGLTQAMPAWLGDLTTRF